MSLEEKLLMIKLKYFKATSSGRGFLLGQTKLPTNLPFPVKITDIKIVCNDNVKNDFDVFYNGVFEGGTKASGSLVSILDDLNN